MHHASRITRATRATCATCCTLSQGGHAFSVDGIEWHQVRGIEHTKEQNEMTWYVWGGCSTPKLVYPKTLSPANPTTTSTEPSATHPSVRPPARIQGAAPAYPARQAYTDGHVGRYGKRERPHLVFDPDTGTGYRLHR